MRRLEVAERKLGSTVQTKCVVMDFNGHYFGECGFDLSQEQFDAWVKQQEKDVEIMVIKYVIEGGNLSGKAVSKLFSGSTKKPCLGVSGQSIWDEALCWLKRKLQLRFLTLICRYLKIFGF